MKQIHQFRVWMSDRKCLSLNIFLVFFLLLIPLLESNRTWNGVLMLGFYLVMLFAPYFVSRNRRVLLLTLISGGILLLPKGFFSFGNSSEIALGGIQVDQFTMGLLICFEVLLTCCVMYYSLKPQRKEGEPVCGCILTFLLLAVTFGDTFFLLSQLFPHAFELNGEAFFPTISDMQYFSFATLTTTGYGDITAVHPFLRQIASLEAVCGVLYVALFVGRIIKIGGGTLLSPRK